MRVAGPINDGIYSGLDDGLSTTMTTTTFEIPIVSTDRLRLRAFRASDLDAYSTMQANPEVMRYMVMGRTSTRAEVWRTMATSLGAWVLRGYGMWACEKIDDGAFIGSVGIFQPLDWPEPEIAYSLDLHEIAVHPIGVDRLLVGDHDLPVSGERLVACRSHFRRHITRRPSGTGRSTALPATGCNTRRSRPARSATRPPV